MKVKRLFTCARRNCLHVLYMYSTCALHLLYMCSTCALHVLNSYSRLAFLNNREPTIMDKRLIDILYPVSSGTDARGVRSSHPHTFVLYDCEEGGVIDTELRCYRVSLLIFGAIAAISALLAAIAFLIISIRHRDI